MKIFAPLGIKAHGNLLPYSEFKLFSDYENPTVNEKKMAQVIANAEKALADEIPMLPASMYRQYVTNGNRSVYEGRFFKRRDMVLWLSLAEWYEKKGRFTEKLMDVIWAIMEESTWMVPAHLYNNPVVGAEMTLSPVYGDNMLHGIDLFSATTCAVLTTAYVYAKDELDKLTPVVANKMKYMLNDRFVKPFLHCTFWWTGERGNAINNWCPWIISNLLYQVALTEESDDVRRLVVDKSIMALDNFLNCYHPDGGCDEGPSYWGAAGASLFDCLELLEDMSGGRINVYSNDLIRNIGEYIYKVNINANKVVNFADCGPTVTPPASLLIRYGEKCSSPFLVSFGKKIAALGDFGVGYWQMYRGIKALFTPDVEAENCPMPLATYLPDLKVVTMRQSEDSAKGVFLGIKGGSNGEMHNHNDVGNFIVYKDGNPVIIDTGVGTYTKQTFSNRRYELWFMQSGYHNLPSFGGVDQKEGGAFRSSDEEYSEEGRSFRCQLKNAYPAAAGVTDFVRCAKLSEGRVTVSDSITLAEEKEIVFHYMCATRPEIKEAGVIALAEGMTMRYNPELACEIEEFEPTGMNAKASWGTDMLYRIIMKAFTDRIEHTVVIE